jgi:hypothetical protein
MEYRMSGISELIGTEMNVNNTRFQFSMAVAWIMILLFWQVLLKILMPQSSEQKMEAAGHKMEASGTCIYQLTCRHNSED